MPASSVTKADDGSWTFTCPRPAGCGNDAGPFTSAQWATKTAAAERGQAHLKEHDTGIPMIEIGAWMKGER